ncbi:hypothetical protein XPU_4181, partial [Xanthomonas arboricola pv. pruni str. MAFF 311562]
MLAHALLTVQARQLGGGIEQLRQHLEFGNRRQLQWVAGDIAEVRRALPPQHRQLAACGQQL